MGTRLIVSCLLSLILHLILILSLSEKNKDISVRLTPFISMMEIEGKTSGKKISNSNLKNSNQQKTGDTTTSQNGTLSNPGDVQTGEGSGNFFIEKPVYPQISRQYEEEGDVLVKINCIKNEACKGIILKSSGYFRLDESVIQTISKVKPTMDIDKEFKFVFKLDQ